MKRILSTALVSLLMSSLTIGVYHFSGIGQESTAVVPTATDEPLKEESTVFTRFETQPTESLAPDFRSAAQRTMPAVVHIKSIASRRTSSWDEFFWGRRSRGQNVSTGSGVIISTNGLIVTNNHVIAEADELEVTLFDNRTYSAQVIGTDRTTDLGLIKIDAADLPMVELANSDNARVGEWVLAVGNPFNLASTATAGIVSAIGRDLEIIRGQMAIESFIQTDAAVNPGNSGGALVNLEGQLLGINTAIASPTGAYAGYAFAVPANIVRKVVDDLQTFGTVQRAYLGVEKQVNVNTDIAQRYGLDIYEGVLLTQIYARGGAAKAGLKEEDVIVKVDGITIKNEAKLEEVIARNRPGDVISVTVNRKGSLKTLQVQLTDVYGKTNIEAAPRREILSRLGAEFEEADSRILDKYDLDGGVQISKLVAGEIRRQTEIEEGFIILKVNGEEVGSPESLIRRLERSKGRVNLEGFYNGDRYLREYTFNIR